MEDKKKTPPALFVNDYVMSDMLIREILAPRQKDYAILFGVSGLLLIGFLGFLQSDAMLSIYFLVLLAILWGVSLYRLYRIRDKMKKQELALGRGHYIRRVNSFYFDNFVTLGGYHLDYSHITRVRPTKNGFLMYVDDALPFYVAGRGFTKGNVVDFIDFLMQRGVGIPEALQERYAPPKNAPIMPTAGNKPKP